MDKKKRKNFTIRMDAELAKDIKMQAIKENRSVSDIINELVKAYLDSLPR